MWNLNGGMDLRYNGAWQAGNYSDGDIVVYQGVAYLCVRPTNKAPTPWAPGQLVVQPSVRVYRSTNQSIPNGAWTTITFDTTRYDRGPAAHWNINNPTRLTCQVAGVYDIVAAISFGGAVGGNQRACGILLNGGAYAGIGGMTAFTPTNGINYSTISAQLYLNIGDYVELQVYQDSGAALAINASPQYSPEFSMALVGGMQGPPGVGIPAAVQNGQYLKGVGGQIVFNNVVEDTAWHNVGASGEPAFQNGWTNYNAPQFPAAAFRRGPDGFVHLKGLIANGTVGTNIFTLPAGYRPAAWSHFLCESQSALGSCEVQANGSVQHVVGTNAWHSLAQIHFLAEG